MKMLKIKTLLVLLLSLLVLTSAAFAGESKPKYRKTTGQVVSADPTSIVIKGRSKQPVAMAVNASTEIIGAKSAKAGDKAAVNYRVDKNGKTATRIKILDQSTGKAAASAVASAAAQKQQ